MITSLTFDDISPAYLPLSKLKNLIYFLDEINITCTFFVVPYGFKTKSPTDEYVKYLRTAKDFGHELALHGYKHAKNEFGYLHHIPLPSFFPFPTFKTQKERVERGMKRLVDLIGVKPLGFRAPFYLHNNATFRALSKLGFIYDSSKTMFKPTHSLRFRVRWLSRFKPFMVHGVTEIPVTGDYTFNLKSMAKNSSTNNVTGHVYPFDALRKAMADFELVRSYSGVFVLNNHPNYFNHTGWCFLRTLVKKLSKRTDFLRLCDIVQVVNKS